MRPLSVERWGLGRLELTLADGEAASSGKEGLGLVWGPMTLWRVVKMPGGKAVGKWRLMWGLEVGVPGRETMGS